MKNNRRGKAQSTLEYAIVIAVVAGALIAMSIYMKRSMQGRLRESTDDVGEQFEAENTTVTRNVSRFSKTLQTVSAGETKVDLTTPENRTESGSETVENW